MSTLKEDLDAAYKKKVIGTLEKTVRAVAVVVDNELAVTTPVDTGRARANWLPSLNTPDLTVIPPLDVKPGAIRLKGGGEIRRTADIKSAIAAYKIADRILITNNLPYIKKLNDGYSAQAPAGFIDAAIMKGKNAVRGAARAIVQGKTR